MTLQASACISVLESSNPCEALGACTPLDISVLLLIVYNLRYMHVDYNIRINYVN